MDWKYLFTSRDGRINRQPFWIGLIVLIVVSIILQFILVGIVGPLITFIVTLPIFYAAFAISLKRAHDRDRPDWYVIGYYVLALVIQVALLTSDPLAPSLIVTLLSIPAMIWAIVMLIDLGFLRGTRGANKYGPDPLGA
ncbi:DUF805 domain-containing protein [Terrihabitans soli]|uniref:DUF805 domain-containing protein n=1 Tax=Terrihabitans soli TaxID=708113 RepID=A0A6S6QY95_9HYPH|nr:DUF805 domain-containing protein [Terrihabitans soli]BCJ92001.1 DUF805 domain-containing protein [Terrihabitans soli]